MSTGSPMAVEGGKMNGARSARTVACGEVGRSSDALKWVV